MPTAVPPELLAQISAAIADIRYGTVNIVIHDARIVQIEKAEKIRFTETSQKPNRTPGGAESALNGRMS